LNTSEAPGFRPPEPVSPKILAGSANPGLARAICAHLGVPLAASEVIRFSDGNLFVRVLENVRGAEIFIVQGISHPVNENFVELLFWIDALKRASASQVTAVIPFFSYAKGDKKDEPRVSIRARVCAEAIEAAGVDRVLTMDLHSPQIQGFFRRPVDHLYALPVIVDYFRAACIADLTVASADVGFGKQAAKFANALSAPVVIGNKQRVDHSEEARNWGVIGEVKDRNVLIVDDIVFTGGSLIALAQALKALGARDIYAAVTHGVLTAGAGAKLAASQSAGSFGGSPVRPGHSLDLRAHVDQRAFHPDRAALSSSILGMHWRTKFASLTGWRRERAAGG
jgi:ribose-phosphate pyrophosphokinase